MTGQGDFLSLMERLQALTGRYRVDELLDLFNDDAQFQIMEHPPLVGKESIRRAFEFDAAANTELRFINMVPHRDGLTCQLIARNDRLEAMGINEVIYTSCSISLKEGRIQKFAAAVEEEPLSGSNSECRLLSHGLPGSARPNSRDFARPMAT